MSAERRLGFGSRCCPRQRGSDERARLDFGERTQRCVGFGSVSLSELARTQRLMLADLEQEIFAIGVELSGHSALSEATLTDNTDAVSRDSPARIRKPATRRLRRVRKL